MKSKLGALNPTAISPSSDVLAILARNVAVMLAAQMITFGLSFLFRAALGRYLGDVGYGKLTFALSIGSIFSTFAGLGLAPLVAKEAARNHPAAGRFLTASICLRLAIGLPLYAVFCWIVSLIKSDPETRLLTDLVGLSFTVELVVAMIGAVFQAFQRMVFVSAGIIVEKLTTTVLCIELLQRGYGLTTVGWVLALGTVANLVVSIVLLRKLGTVRIQVDREALWQTFRSGLPFFIWAVFTTIYFRIDATMLSLMTNDAVTGWYGVAYALYETLGFFPSMLKTVLLPSLSRLFVHDPATFRSTFLHAFTAYSLVTPPIAFGTIALAGPIVGLIYPIDQFSNAVGDLRVLSLGCIPLFFNILLATVVVSADKQRYWSAAAVVGAILNPLANLALIPYFQTSFGNGGIGAAWATNVIELLLLGVGLALIPRDLIRSKEWWLVGRTFLAGALMAIAVTLLAPSNLPRALTIGALTYGILCVVFGVARLADLDAIRQAVLRRPPVAISAEGGGS